MSNRSKAMQVIDAYSAIFISCVFNFIFRLMDISLKRNNVFFADEHSQTKQLELLISRYTDCEITQLKNV